MQPLHLIEIDFHFLLDLEILINFQSNQYLHSSELAENEIFIQLFKMRLIENQKVEISSVFEKIFKLNEDNDSSSDLMNMKR